MTQQTIEDTANSHSFLSDSAENEKNTFRVVLLTSAMMIGEIVGGLIFHSMALLADGFHMGTHAFALGVALLAYWYARRNARNPAFTFGTGKVNDLGGYTSAVLLLIVAVIMAYESILRFWNPLPISYTQAIILASVGLAVNLLSAWMLRDKHDHDHGHEDHDNHDEHESTHNDRNIKAAYMHVLADALTSVLAITALVLGSLFGWAFMDPLMGVVGSIVIARWSLGLIRETSGVLLDRTANPAMLSSIRERLESQDGCAVSDLHVWEIGPSRYALVASLTTPRPQPLAVYKQRLADIPRLVHVNIEVNAPEDGKH